jgi:hypothetical protein
VKLVKVHLHIICPFEIVFPIEMGRFSQMYGIEFVVRMVAQKLRVVVGHFVEAGVSVLGLLVLDHLLEELLGHLLRFLLLVLFFTAFLAASLSSLTSSSLETEFESELDEESSELSTLDGVWLGAFLVRSPSWASLSSFS